MGKKYVSRCIVLDSGKRIPHLKNFKWSERKIAEQIKLMDGIGVVDTIPDQTFGFDYAVPAVAPKLDWSDVVDKTYIVQLKSGQRVTFTGVDCLSQGEIAFDGEKESVMPITFSYEDFVIE